MGQVDTIEEPQLPHCKTALLHSDEWTNRGFLTTRKEELHLVQDIIVVSKVKLSTFQRRCVESCAS